VAVTYPFQDIKAGEFSNKITVFFTDKCNNFTDPNGVVSYTMDYAYTGQLNVSVACNIGYVAQPAKATCDASKGKWLPSQPICNRMSRFYNLRYHLHNFNNNIIISS